MNISISPELVLARERRSARRKGVFAFLAAAVAICTVAMLINPATTEEYAPLCGLEEHVHGPECYETVYTPICPYEECEGHVHTDECYETVMTLTCGLEEGEDHVHTDDCWAIDRILVCELEEGQVHEHTEDCIVWEESYICGLEDDPEHVHTDECIKRTPVFVCELGPGVGHIHNEFCTLAEETCICGKTAHVHTEDCYPKLTGDPHADVEIDLDWESTFCDVTLTGNWADDLVAIAESQLGYAESELNFVTDEYNVRHGYTRYGDWYGSRYAGWNALYVMFCLHYAEVWGIPTDSVPANWMNAARAQGFWKEAGDEPARGDLAFFDDNADGLADRVAIVTAYDAETDEFDVLIGSTGTPVELLSFARTADRVAGYLALPTNPDYVTLEEPEDQSADEQPEDGAIDELLAEEPLADEAIRTLDVGTEELADEVMPLAGVDPYDPVALTAETDTGIRATLTGIAASFPYPAEELTLLIREAQAPAEGQAQALAGDLESEGLTSLDVRWLDISVWHEELVAPESPEISEPPLEPVPADPIDITDPMEPGDEIMPLDPIASLDIASFGEEVVAAASSGEPMEAGPVDTPEVPETAEKRLVEVIPTGDVQITVEGLSENGSILVYRVSQYGEAEKLESHTGETRGRVTLTTGLN